VRISANRRRGAYIAYAARLLLENKNDKVVLKASGLAAKHAVEVAEILR